MDNSQLVGTPATVAVNSLPGGVEAPAAAVEPPPKRKRGRPPKVGGKPPPAKKVREEEEDVCFICFDGGSLVLCDRRGCPKAYHPACIKRDEAFFRSRAKWNCGWHICSSCQKAAHYMCYTCTYSLCRACTKYADYLCVRDNKGFCTTCMKTIMLIENNGQGDKEMAQVDFDDKSSWEYLFKVYWILLKGNLSLTLDELTQAQNPGKAAGTVAFKAKSLDVNYGGNDGKGSIMDSSSGHLQANNPEMTKEQPNLLRNGDPPCTDNSISDNGNNSVETKEWASKELLEFVSHMRNGETSVLSQLDVQTLLLDYIKRNNLRDPHQKSQIICDLRLRNLFGKPRVGHVEMLKLLEYHCLTKEDSGKDAIQGNIVHAVVNQVEGDGNNDNLLVMDKLKKHKTRRKGDEKGPQTNLDEYAAIDVHNINLIYLRHNLMESLIVDNGKFHDKVIGSFVRIRISTGDQNQDMYRLVQVVGTSKVPVPYKIGEKTADFMLEILNLDKKESISIDAVSNQEFSEDECQRLRQSIKCGLVKRLTVGQVQETAMALQEVKLDDRLETEMVRLNHLWDRASEMGRKKELRECIEKLELLKTPEERQRRLHEIPEVHADPDMDPNCETAEDPGVNSNNKQDEYVKSTYSGFGRNGREPISSQNGEISNHFGSRVWKQLNSCESMSSPIYLGKGASSMGVERMNESLWNEGKDASVGSFSGVGSEASVAPLSTGSAPSVPDSKTDMLWRYRDPSGKIQGPFCLLQLRKWSTTGYFPPDMRIWTNNDEEGDSLLLSDVLNGQFQKVTPMRYDVSLLFEEVEGGSDSRLYNCDGGGWSSSANATEIDGKQTEGEGQRCNTLPNHGDRISHGNITNPTTGGQIHENQSSGQGGSGQAFGESWKSVHVNDSSNNWDSNSGFAPVVKSTDSSERNLGIDINLPSPTPKTSVWDLEDGQTTKEQQSAPSNVYVQDLNIPNPPSTTSKPIDGDEKADCTTQNTPSPLSKPAYEDEIVEAAENMRSLSCSTFRVQDSVPSSCNELNLPPSSSHPASSWLAMVTAPIEISTLSEESVSDLLAEVDAMESQGGGLASPTSSVNGGEELFQVSKPDCFTSHGGLVPALESAKNDAFGPANDAKLPPQRTVAVDERMAGKSSTSTKVEVETKPTDTDTAHRARVKPIEPSGGTMHNTNSGKGGSPQGVTNTGRGTGQGTPRGISTTNRGASAGFTGRESHSKYGGERHTGTRDRVSQGRDSGFGGGRPSYGRQASFGSGGSGSGGSYSRLPPPKGQRVCKFYESGYCKKGANCNYLHP